MPLLSTPVSRRYTPPTCTLEITAQTAALSPWTRQPLQQELQFQLSFEAAQQLHQDQSIQIRGDRAQLEALGEAVESYVQEFLAQAPTDLIALTPRAALSQPEFVDEQHAAALSIVEGWDQKIHLRPQGLLSHDLFLGPLANQTSGPVINLSISSLFDLASALEASIAEALTLVPPEQQRRDWLQTPLWTRVAAIAALFVGVTTAVLQLSNSSSGPENTSPVISRTNESDPSTPLPPPPNASLPPFQNLPSVTVPPTPSIDSEFAKGIPNSGQVALNPQQSTLPTPVRTPQTPKQPPTSGSIAIEPNASGDSPVLPDVPDIATSNTEPAAKSSISSSEAAGSSPAQSSQTAFDVVPQVAEVRSYFQQRWKPPQNLNQTLEYTLILNSNGSIQQTIPLNQAAKTYVDRTPLPLRNEPFVSPVQGRGSAKIRLVLGPNGSVQTFLQSSN